MFLAVSQKNQALGCHFDPLRNLNNGDYSTYLSGMKQSSILNCPAGQSHSLRQKYNRPNIFQICNTLRK